MDSPYGVLFGDNGFPFAPKDFAVRAGLEGPQAICTWAAADVPFARVMIRRKRREYPRHPRDGVLVADLPTSSGGAAIDIATDLLPADAEPGDAQWWYYRAFVLQAAIPTAARFGGRGRQDVASAFGVEAASLGVDVQAYDRMAIVAQNAGATHNLFVWLESAPTEDGPWTEVRPIQVIAPGAAKAFELTNISYKYIRAVATGEPATVWFEAPWAPVWNTGATLSRPCLVYKSGKHEALAYERGHLPEFYITADAQQPHIYTSTTIAPYGELFSLGKVEVPEPPLRRFLRVLFAELDRTDAYLKSVRSFDHSISEMPEALLSHVAYELGWSIDPTRPLEDIRQELLRLPGVWKSKGTTRQLERVVQQFLGVVPHVQETQGQLVRFADPDLFDME